MTFQLCSVLKHHLQNFIDARQALANALIVGALVSGCGGGGSGGSEPAESPGQQLTASDDVGDIAVQMQVDVPAQIVELDAVDLEYSIELKGAGIVTRVNPGDNFNVPFTASGSGRYYFRIEVRVLGTGMLIAVREGSKWIDSDQTLVVSDAHFDTNGPEFDLDGDGTSNLDELSSEGNPGVPESTQILFSFRVADWLQDMYDDGIVRFETVVDSLANNNGKFPISFNPDTNQHEATGFGLEVGGQPRSIGISARIASSPYHFDGVGLALASASRLMTLRSGSNEAHFEWSDFVADWDQDRDGTPNLTELRRGTNPLATDPEYTIPVVAGGVVPIIDGDLQESSWYALRLVEAGGNALPIDVILEGAADSSDNPAERFFTAVHDFTNLYVGVQIRDNTIVVDSAQQRWLDDSIEVYIDGDNSRLSSYDGTNDLALNFRFDDASAQASRVVAGSDSLAVPDTLQYAMTHDFARGVTQLEFVVPLADLSIDIRVGMGLEVQYNDDDDSGGRDRKYGWRGPAGEDNAWMNPTWFGEIEFSN